MSPLVVRRCFFVLYGLVAAGLLLPLVPGVWGLRPFTLGLPMAFAWVVLLLLVTFGSLVWMYRSDYRDAGDESGDDGDPS